VTQQTIVLAGAAGDLGTRITKALIGRSAAVRALVRNRAPTSDRQRLSAIGAIVAPADVAVAGACEGAACVVSALNGLRKVIIDRQRVLLDRAVKAGVPRFISSDYSADFTKTQPGGNRNLDLRREFMARADSTATRAPIRVTSVLNGAFMDMLGAEMPIIQPRIHRVLHWGSADQPLDFTTKDDVAAYVAATALDNAAPRILRVAGDTVSARDIAQAMAEVTGERYGTLWAGSIGSLSVLIRLAKLVAPQPQAAFPPWQGMQYMRDMFSRQVKLHPLDNTRYSDRQWTSVREQLDAGPAYVSRQKQKTE